MNKQAFNARARVGRALARVARMSHDGWAYDQAGEYARTGYIGPDLGAYLEWYWRGGDFPYVSLGASRRGDDLWGDPGVARVRQEVQQGLHNTSSGLRPHRVFRDREGAICVAYPGGIGWIAWETKVSY